MKPLFPAKPTQWHTKSGTLIATGYVRIVHGGRGDYVEFERSQLVWDNLEVPAGQEYRLASSWKEKVYYLEYRSKDESHVKVYDQLKLVSYADYKVGLLYIAVGDITSSCA